MRHNLYQSPPLSLPGKAIHIQDASEVTPVRGIWVTGNVSGNSDEDYYNFLYSQPLLAAPPSPRSLDNKLNPVTNVIEYLSQNKTVILNSVSFYPLGSVLSTGGAGYTAEQINTLLEESTQSTNHAIPQGRVRLGGMPLSQPNWFRPTMIVNSNWDLAKANDTSFDVASSTNVKSHLSIGFSAPFTIQKPIQFDEGISQLDVYAQYIVPIAVEPGVIRYQKYPVICEAEFEVWK